MGSDLVGTAGGMAEAARQLKLPQLTNLTETRAYIARTHHLQPGVADGAMSIYTSGAAPKYEESPAKAAPDGGYPRDPRSSGK